MTIPYYYYDEDTNTYNNYEPTVAEWSNYYYAPETDLYYYDQFTNTYNYEPEPSPYANYY